MRRNYKVPIIWDQQMDIFLLLSSIEGKVTGDVHKVTKNIKYQITFFRNYKYFLLKP